MSKEGENKINITRYRKYYNEREVEEEEEREEKMKKIDFDTR